MSFLSAARFSSAAMESSFPTLQEEEDDAVVFLYISTVPVLEGLLKFGARFQPQLPFFLRLHRTTLVVEQWIRT